MSAQATSPAIEGAIPIIPLSRLRNHSPRAVPSEQHSILESVTETSLPTFCETLTDHGLQPLRATSVEVLQVNVGKLCNQTCRHCHVDAGPDRRESMSRKTAESVIRVLRASKISTLDITGGAPEMNPNFCWLVQQAHLQGCRVIDRCNLTILVAKGYEFLSEFLARHEVEIVASLPCYLQENCDSQRGNGVFERSIKALRRLNELGYGLPDSPLKLILAYNPLGPSLPSSQAILEADYRRELRDRYGVEFTGLYTITNMPISRFLDDLLQTGQYDDYMRKLVDAFNPQATAGVMCRTTLSVDWQGKLYDCDFNQMLGLELSSPKASSIHDIEIAEINDRKIITGRHCFGCTAGAGSGCQGAVISLRTL